MTTDNFEKELHKILSLLRDIDMKVNHIIERLKSSYSYFNSVNEKNTSELR
jgi:hypothetical protein